MPPPKPDAARKKVRCAIYTRKSTDEGLEQEFNSLDAQREACSAYILSQRHEGWIELPDRYDDGGYSGGTMDRPGIKRLLADVEADRVDVILLYKVDRLTRSLADFARIVEVLDKAGASFVSITQAFNTTTSMGRLTLNVLLSFAQFEREVTGERIRDKIAASKAKGMWMGGNIPLGYRLHERKLIIDDEEAATVRDIFKRYAALKSTSQLAEELHRRGVVTKRREFKDGRVFGSIPFRRGALAHLLQNVVYVGEVHHRGQQYPGEHSAIIERVLWDKVQRLLQSNRRERRTRSRGAEPSMLAGVICDGLGRPMTPTHATKGTRRYRYYVSRTESADPHRGWSIPAHGVEQLVLDRTASFIGEGKGLVDRLSHPTSETIELVHERCSELASRLAACSPSAARPLLLALRIHVQVRDEGVTVTLDPSALLSSALGEDAKWLNAEVTNYAPLELVAPVKIRRRGQELRLVFRSSDPTALRRVDPKLLDVLAKADRARATLLRSGGSVDPKELPHVTRLARLSYLAPDIVSAIVQGRQPADMSARTLLRVPHLPVSWEQQRKILGFS